MTDATLSTLARAETARLKQFAETLIEPLGDIEVVQSRTGLVMLPMRDTAQGTAFHLGEVLVSEAHIRSQGHEGYGMRRGTDLQAAMAMALVDLALQTGVSKETCEAFCAAEAAAQQADDTAVLRKVEATRVDMETF
ncbi:phosphonate metabolism protein PhnG [Actibacterium mucosum KCTC 23349]|uniref:Phosphonate metabolism protein PhnG n=1 Tax=Actibacterium mucosum KCTC 23349 TaxID=1454373 RepID=A0A037ZCP1_9RHOB|nr:phosphonate C-P lyase system protein PhnG [Actibacterium mucosum]KAJ54269.1 phosphonate metabolism protein PhnG [Actibacterium mucosum KCTC 23349]